MKTLIVSTNDITYSQFVKFNAHVEINELGQVIASPDYIFWLFPENVIKVKDAYSLLSGFTECGYIGDLDQSFHIMVDRANDSYGLRVNGKELESNVAPLFTPAEPAEPAEPVKLLRSCNEVEAQQHSQTEAVNALHEIARKAVYLNTLPVGTYFRFCDGLGLPRGRFFQLLSTGITNRVKDTFLKVETNAANQQVHVMEDTPEQIEQLVKDDK